ncbi:hypothetical protein DPX39_110053100 [Trypanosoma brucei equiperdum]|uniref:Uncharacterized protein n=1 Tax=Trypanosoma brucei equiperdum TaxID=630700 RepID=A0A3L6KTX0_9TRYP|nr:hypothetical protein DPX39_110053100 [Trypanosoma brucei equiperdum]
MSHPDGSGKAGSSITHAMALHMISKASLLAGRTTQQQNNGSGSVGNFSDTLSNISGFAASAADNSVRNGATVAASVGNHERHGPVWIALLIWLSFILVVIFIIARFVLWCLSSLRAARAGYNEIWDGVGYSGNRSAMAATDGGAPSSTRTSVVGNASRQQFRHSRQKAARRSYGTENPSAEVEV